MTKVLRLTGMIFRQGGTLTRRVVQGVVAIALRLFFRRIEADGVEKVPLTEPLIFVLNHPNGLIDPALVFVALPRRVSFLAKSTLFRVPGVGFFLRTVEALPLYRRVDAGDINQQVVAPAQNQKTFEACFKLLRQNRCIALFPEGISNNSTYLLPLKTGAARIALGALSIEGENLNVTEDAKYLGENSDQNLFINTALKSLKIVPVGLYYTSKTSFRSEALLRFGAPFTVLPVTLDADGQPPREAVRELSEVIAEKLREVTLNVEDTEAFEVVRRTEQLFSSVYEGLNFHLSLTDELDLRRRFAEQFESNAENAQEFKNRLDIYDKHLRELGVSPEHLSVSGHSFWYVFRHFFLRIGLILVLSPLVIVGAILHFPAYLICLLIGKVVRQHGVDDSGGSPKILAAMLLMPLTWLISTGLVLWLWNWHLALVTFPLVIVCGYSALRCLEELFDLRGWFKAAWVLLLRRWLFIRLLFERRALHRAIAEIIAPTDK
ncbi:MAG: lysophospholipid acyltransferase family protein [Pyrinomonadaceae bacterium]